MAESELPLQSRVRVADSGVGTKRIAEAQVAHPMRAVPLHHVEMVGPELAAPEELATRHTTVPTIDVAKRFEQGYVSRRSGSRCVTRSDVKNRFGRKARDSRTAYVFQRQLRQSSGCNRSGDSFGLAFEQRRPTIVVRNNAYRLGFKS